MFPQVKIIGFLGQNPVLHFLESGKQVCNFSVATTHNWTGRDGALHADTTWFQVAAWGAMGANAHQYLTRGRRVMVIGELVIDPQTGGLACTRSKMVKSPVHSTWLPSRWSSLARLRARAWKNSCNAGMRWKPLSLTCLSYKTTPVIYQRKTPGISWFSQFSRWLVILIEPGRIDIFVVEIASENPLLKLGGDLLIQGRSRKIATNWIEKKTVDNKQPGSELHPLNPAVQVKS